MHKLALIPVMLGLAAAYASAQAPPSQAPAAAAPGAKATLKDAQGKTALDVAAANGNLEAQQAIKVLGTAKAASETPPAAGQGTTSQ